MVDLDAYGSGGNVKGNTKAKQNKDKQTKQKHQELHLQAAAGGPLFERDWQLTVLSVFNNNLGEVLEGLFL